MFFLDPDMYTDGNPEFQVRVKEWKDPMCFQLNGEDKQVFRLVQDRQTGI